MTGEQKCLVWIIAVFFAFASVAMATAGYSDAHKACPSSAEQK